MFRSFVCTFAFAALLLADRSPADELRAPVTFRKLTLAERFFAEGSSFGDLNGDGHADLIAGSFWFEGPSFESRHTFYPPRVFDPAGYSDNFFVFVHDLNGDGRRDILVYGFPGQDASWYENPGGGDGHWTRHVVLDVVDNESPTWVDLTGDGRPEIVCSQGGNFGYATPDWNAPEKPWAFHPISDGGAGGRFTHGLGVGDLNGDGRLDILEKSGWWEQPPSLEGNPRWKKHEMTFSGPGGSQMYAYDVDGDGRNDVITSLAAHGFGLAWYRQLADGTFERRLIMGERPEDNKYGVKFAELHAVDLVDIDGDGLKDLVTGKRWWSHGATGDPDPQTPAVIYWFRLQRGASGEVDWVPYKIDDDSGVGVQVVAADFSGDQRPDIVVANKKGIFAFIQEPADAPASEGAAAAGANPGAQP